jgi:hypothetical protein
MALQIVMAGDEAQETWIKALVCGPPGSGKTRSASTWPKPIFAAAEGGMLSIRDRPIPIVQIKNTNTLLELKNVLGQAPDVRSKMLGPQVEAQGGVETVVIDTFDEVARLFVEERKASERKETLAIQDWGWLADQLRGLVRGFRNLDMHVVLNCHVRTVEDGDTGKTFVKPAIQGAMGDDLPAYVDLAVVLDARPKTVVDRATGENKREIARVMQTYPDQQRPWVKDRSGKLPMEFPVNLDNDYTRMATYIFGAPPTRMTTVSRESIATESSPSASTVTPPTEAPAAAPTGESAKKAPAKKAAAKKAAPPRAGAAQETPPVVAPAPEPPVPDMADVAGEGAEPAAEAPQAAEEPRVNTDPPVEVPVNPAPAEGPLTTGAPEGTPVETPESVPDGGTPVADTATNGKAPAAAAESQAEAEQDKPVWQVCEECGGDIENRDQADLSFVRFRKRLCRKDFRARAAAKK